MPQQKNQDSKESFEKGSLSLNSVSTASSSTGLETNMHIVVELARIWHLWFSSFLHARVSMLFHMELDYFDGFLSTVFLLVFTMNLYQKFVSATKSSRVA